MFIPWFRSQTFKELLFRTTGSMTYPTILNFSMNDIIKRLTRIEFLNNVQTVFQKKLRQKHRNASR